VVGNKSVENLAEREGLESRLDPSRAYTDFSRTSESILDFPIKTQFSYAEEFLKYEASPDGQHFVINVNGEQNNAPPVDIILNWASQLAK
jgi:hypothetical protein